MKPIDMNKTVYELSWQYPEIIDLMADLGFTEIRKPAILNSVGRMMTIPKGAKMKNINMMDVMTAFLQNGFEPVGEMPKHISIPVEVKQEDAGEHTTGNALKSYLKRLGNGESLEEVRADFAKHFATVEASEIMFAEQQLMQEGTPLEEVQRLCDLHSALFHGATREEQIFNAEKEVEASLYRVQTNSSMARLKEINGHPLSVFAKENTKLQEVFETLEKEIEKGNMSALSLESLGPLSVHYAKKGDLLYPLLKVRYDISGPSDVMWTVDDEIRHELTELRTMKTRDEDWLFRLQAVLMRAKEMIYKEENILFPICVEHFTEEEWTGIYRDSKDYDVLFDLHDPWKEAEVKLASEAQVEEMKQGEVVLAGGHMRIEQLSAMLNTLPMEISFVDDANINRYFNEGEKVFKRPQMALDREVFACHPPKIEPMVRTILESFRDGSKDRVPVWMEKNGKPLLIQYMAVRDHNRKYLGTIELVQDMSEAKAYFTTE